MRKNARCRQRTAAAAASARMGMANDTTSNHMLVVYASPGSIQGPSLSRP